MSSAVIYKYQLAVDRPPSPPTWVFVGEVGDEPVRSLRARSLTVPGTVRIGMEIFDSPDGSWLREAHGCHAYGRGVALPALAPTKRPSSSW